MAKRDKTPDEQPPATDPNPGTATRVAAETRAPDEWVKITGEGREMFLEGKWRWVPSARHAAAVVLHGWQKHAHHAGAPFMLTREQYEAALRAAEPEVGIPVPVPECTSQYLNSMM